MTFLVRFLVCLLIPQFSYAFVFRDCGVWQAEGDLILKSNKYFFVIGKGKDTEVSIQLENLAVNANSDILNQIKLTRWVTFQIKQPCLQQCKAKFIVTRLAKPKYLPVQIKKQACN